MVIPILVLIFMTFMILWDTDTLTDMIMALIIVRIT